MGYDVKPVKRAFLIIVHIVANWRVYKFSINLLPGCSNYNRFEHESLRVMAGYACESESSR